MDAPETLALVPVGADADAEAVLATVADCLGASERPFSLAVHLPTCASALDGRKTLEAVLRSRGAAPELAERARFDLPAPGSDEGALLRLERNVAAVIDRPDAAACLVVAVSPGCRCVRGWDDELRRQARAAPGALLSAAAEAHGDDRRVFFPCARWAEGGLCTTLAALHERPPCALPLTMAGASLLAGPPDAWAALLDGTAAAAVQAESLHQLEVLLGLLCFRRDVALLCPTAPIVRAQRGVARPVAQRLDAPSRRAARKGYSRFAGIDLERHVVYGQAQVGLTRDASVQECLAKTGGLVS